VSQHENFLKEGLSELRSRIASVAMESPLKYMHGFGNHFESESIPDTLPKNQNSPQVRSSCYVVASVRFAWLLGFLAFSSLY
jgi:hypothetical protein